MDDKLNRNPNEAQTLTDEELDRASGGMGPYRVPSAPRTYVCDMCMVWYQTRIPGKYTHKRCGNEMRWLKAAGEEKNVKENTAYHKASPGEVATL